LSGLACFALACACWPGRAQDPPQLPAQLKAAYILNFVRYATWPDGPATRLGPLVVCLAGDDSADVARQLRPRSAAGRPLAPRLMRHDERADSCHALYIDKSARQHQAALLARVRHMPVLTIGDGASFLADGGIIAMTQSDGAARFTVSLAAAKRSAIALHPRLLALAERVEGGEPR
jgi:hypothetical protein